jgi:hypothetical protein
MATSDVRCARHGRCTRLGLFIHVTELDCRSRGETPIPSFFAALGLGAALGLAFFGVCAGWIVVVGGDPEPPFSAALVFLLFVGVLCCVVVKKGTLSKWAARHLPEQKKVRR